MSQYRSGSAAGALKRRAAIFGVLVLVWGIILHVALPWFDFLDVLGFIFGGMIDYPLFGGIVITLVVTFIVIVWIHDNVGR